MRDSTSHSNEEKNASAAALSKHDRTIKDDHLEWIHVSDLQYWNSPVVKLFGVEGIPYTYLLDKNGKIIAKGLMGKALEDKLKELLG